MQNLKKITFDLILIYNILYLIVLDSFTFVCYITIMLIKFIL